MAFRPLILLALLPTALAACGEREAANEALPSGHEPAAPAAASPAAGVGPPTHPKPTRSDTIPARFHGLFDASASACGKPGEYRLAVSAKELRFHESAAIVRSVTIDSPDSIHVAGDYQGEGESWKATRQLRLSEGGSKLTVAGDGTELVRIRCVDRPAPEPSTRWETSASGEGAALYLAHFHLGGERVVTLFCPAGSNDLLVNVPGFRPVGSEERMSFGAGGTAVALVADPRGDRQRGGVTGRGPVPSELPTILRSRIAVNYGSQNSGPYAPPSPEMAKSFLAGCRD